MTDSRHLENRQISCRDDAERVCQAYQPSAILDFKNELFIGGAHKTYVLHHSATFLVIGRSAAEISRFFAFFK